VRSVLTFFVVTVPRLYREWRWRRIQVHLPAKWIEERKQRRELQALTED
jgi:hypothetical protein